MDPIMWTNDYNVGISRIDTQNMKLVSMMNRLLRNRLLRKTSTTTNSDMTSDLLSDMIRFAREYFWAEEELMYEYNFPEVHHHVKHHREFVEMIVDSCDARTLGGTNVPQSLLICLRDWLEYHILVEDKKFGPYFQDINLTAWNNQSVPFLL